MAGIEIRGETEDDRTVLFVAGELDAVSAPCLDDALRRAAGQGGASVVLDLRHVTFVDSTGLRSMIVAHRDGALVLRAPSASVRRLLEVAGMADLFTIED